MGHDPVAGVMARVRQHRLFKAAGEPGAEELLRHSRLVEVPSRAPIVAQGKPADAFFIVLRGRVQLLMSDEACGVSTVDVLTPGDLFGQGAAVGGFPYALSAQALESTCLLRIEAEAFRRLLDQRFDLVAFVLATLSRRLCGLVRQLTDLKMKTGGQRVANYLLSLTEAERGTVEIRLPFDKRIIAETLGMRPETFSRALAKLRAVGVERAGSGRLVMHDVGRLRAYCRLDGGEARDH